MPVNTRDIKNIIEANVWIIKYLIAASVELGVGVLIKRGIKAIKLNSSPAHIAIHGSEEITNIVLRNRFIIKNE